MGLAARILSQSVAGLVFARIVGPSAYGVIGLGTVYAMLMTLLLTQGMGPALIRQRNQSPTDLGTVNISSLVLSLLLAVLTLFTSEAVSGFFRAPALRGLLLVLALGLVFKALIVVPQAVLLRTQRFGALASSEALASLLGAAVGISVTAAGGGVWGFAVQVLSTDFLLTALLWRRAGVPPWRWKLASLRRIASFTTNVSATQLVGFLARNADNVLIGRVLGPTPLAFYMLGYRVMRLPIASLVMVANRALYPLFSSYQDDRGRLRRNYLLATQAMAFVVVPLMGLIVVFAPEIIAIIFGDPWQPAVAPTRVLAFAAVFQTLSGMITPAVMATGRERIQLAWTVASTSVLLVSFALTVSHGIVWVAYAYAAVQVIFFPPAVSIVGQALGFSFPQYIRAITPALVAGGTVWVAGWLIREGLVSSSSGSAMTLVLGVPGAVLAGLALGLSAFRQSISDQARLVRRLVTTR